MFLSIKSIVSLLTKSTHTATGLLPPLPNDIIILILGYLFLEKKKAEPAVDRFSRLKKRFGAVCGVNKQWRDCAQYVMIHSGLYRYLMARKVVKIHLQQLPLIWHQKCASMWARKDKHGRFEHIYFRRHDSDVWFVNSYRHGGWLFWVSYDGHIWSNEAIQ